MKAPIGYGWHPETGEFVGEVTADPSPLEKDVWLWPARTTQVTPPKLKTGQAAVFIDGDWRVVADHRGETWFEPDGAPVKIIALGDPLEAGLVANAPAPEPVRASLPKWLIVARLTDEQLEAAMAMMTTRQRERWRAAAFPDIYLDDPELLAVLEAVGADEKSVLAPQV